MPARTAEEPVLSVQQLQQRLPFRLDDNTSIVIGILMAVIIVALTVVIGYFYAKGHTWARITAFGLK